MNTFKKVIFSLILIVVIFSAVVPMQSAHALSCGVGQVEKNGKCVDIKITQNEKLSRTAHCLSMHGQTVKSFNTCMKTHRGNYQVK